MNKVILEFTYKGRKHTYLRRIGLDGDIVTTTNVHSAKRIKESDAKELIKTIYMKLGTDNVKSIRVIKDET